MTIEDRYVFDLDDIKAVRFDCTNPNCGATLSAPLERWTRVPAECPRCRSPWAGPATALEDALNLLFAAFTKLKDHDAHLHTQIAAGRIPERGARLRFEIDRPR